MAADGVPDPILKPGFVTVKGVRRQPQQLLLQRPPPEELLLKGEDQNRVGIGSIVSLVEVCFPLMLQIVDFSMSVMWLKGRVAKLEKFVYGTLTSKLLMNALLSVNATHPGSFWVALITLLNLTVSVDLRVLKKAMIQFWLVSVLMTTVMDTAKVNRDGLHRGHSLRGRNLPELNHHGGNLPERNHQELKLLEDNLPGLRLLADGHRIP